MGAASLNASLSVDSSLFKQVEVFRSRSDKKPKSGPHHSIKNVASS